MPPPLPMSEALDFWQQKIQLPPAEFYRLAEAQRVRAFTVSGLARADMLHQVHQSLETALRDGITLEQFKKNLAGVWEENGWTGHKAWRIDNIFRTNLQTAYNVGRYKQMAEVAEDRPFWQYSAVNDSRTRPTHRALHGKVYPHDSPFWDTWYPPNGFRCRCKVKTLSADDVRARGLAVEEYLKDDLIEPVGEHGPMPARPLRPDAGFAGNPGKEAWSGLSPEPIDEAEVRLRPTAMVCPNLRGASFAEKSSHNAPCGLPLADIPARYIHAVAPQDILPTGQPAEFYARAFMAEFGLGLHDAKVLNIPGTSLPLVIDKDLLLDKRKPNRPLKTLKMQRAPYMKLLARTILDPFEVWQAPVEVTGRGMEALHFVRLFGEERVGGFAVFSLLDMRRWVGSTAYTPNLGEGREAILEAMEARRQGLLIYRQDVWPPAKK
ncbi:putative phage head morphogenesis protein, SPP1 gp7 family [Megalodesulfovibrio gigas DSM 1382 = ATCC 19364]|uniref:Putative phage head morphogenesis protein, SPP1 gp7 family n=1 Tax=Megalodesulfovibrio gigas (strain ATCC 19364 / DSM 1382 / NCIMB 9332 / VKM B-1759) TaxID=1121448 RepID=T2G8B6_MEGG1|nr:putative phage head morphogenesis protein, SPP1 gp7 family [Megalodesulfovibrio gigas DSM 1382 = ATCC 19364]